MELIKYRQPVFNRDGTFNSWHYWGWMSEGTFVSPLSMGHNVKGEFGQKFLGLYDKNKKGMWEGDIVECVSPVIVVSTGRETGEVERRVYIVVYEADKARFNMKDVNKPNEFEFFGLKREFIAQWYTIIGNVYENPGYKGELSEKDCKEDS